MSSRIFLPMNYLSYLAGRLAQLRLPRVVCRQILRAYVRIYSIDLSAASRPLEEYRSLAEFFIRTIKPGLRPIEDGIISPVDGTLRGYGPVLNGRIEQVKGRDYSVQDLLQSAKFGSRFNSGFYFNFYLSPADCHHVYAPVSGEIVAACCIPGNLWPVNNWSVNKISDLFCVNERIVTFIQSSIGLVAAVMVGATNVGKMEVAYDTFQTNSHPIGRHERTEKLYQSPMRIVAGDRLGTFNLGSTVVLLFESAQICPRSTIRTFLHVNYGSRVA